MLSSKILKRREKHNWFYNITEPFFVKLNETYQRQLKYFVAHRWLAIPVTYLQYILIYVLFS